MKKRIVQLVLILSVFAGLIACTEDIEEQPTEEARKETHSETGLYLGITTFSENIRLYTDGNEGYWNEYISSYQYNHYSLLGKWTAHYCESFVQEADMGRATVLYYAVDTTLSYLEQCKFPDDVKSVSVITFTDGLDQGSHALNKKYNENNEAYMEAINRKIQNMNINGIPVTAWTIGVRGNDVQGDAIEVFQNNLSKLASPKNDKTGERYDIEVANIEEVNAKFKEIAEALYKRTESRSLSITLPTPAANTRERFTFDKVTDATKSNLYLEGVYAGGVLKDIEYKGCSSTSGKAVSATQDGVMITFEFENFADVAGDAITIGNMQQWYMNENQTTWTRNSEFKPDEAIKTKEEKTSAVVTLILDCSSSLGNDFAKVKQAACDFIQTLAGEVNNGDIETLVTTAQVRFCKADSYTNWLSLGLTDPNSSSILLSYDFGTIAGTSPYYEIAAGTYEPIAYQYIEGDEETTGWYYINSGTYYFEAGKKYTVTLTDDGEYVYGTVSLDGSMNAPARIVKQWKSPKNAMTKASKQHNK